MVQGEQDATTSRNFLKSVSCEVRFPALLIIQNKIPEFQESIRGKFPVYEAGFPFQINKFSTSMPKEFYEWGFVSEDNTARLKVTTNRIVLSVTHYKTFKEFSTDVINYFITFFKTCNISEFSRIGLRYTNEISLEEDGRPAMDLLLEWFNPIPALNLIRNLNPTSFNSEFRWDIGVNSLTCKNIFGLDKEGHYRYVIDIDSYRQQIIEKLNFESIIEELHSLANEEFSRNTTKTFNKLLEAGKFEGK